MQPSVLRRPPDESHAALISGLLIGLRIGQHRSLVRCAERIDDRAHEEGEYRRRGNDEAAALRREVRLHAHDEAQRPGEPSRRVEPCARTAPASL